MSIAAMTHVWENSQQEGGALLVLLAIADYANDRGEAYPSIKTLAKKARLGERQTQRVIQQLSDDGEIAISEKSGPSGVNVYRIQKGVTKCRGDKMSGVTSPQREGGDMGVTQTVREPSEELVLRDIVKPKTRKTRIGTVNGSKPPQSEIETFCSSLGLPRSDGEITFLKWNAKGWPKNWMDDIRYHKRCGWLPSQKLATLVPKSRPVSL